MGLGLAKAKTANLLLESRNFHKQTNIAELTVESPVVKEGN